jgi:hypothetical protein
MHGPSQLQLGIVLQIRECSAFEGEDMITVNGSPLFSLLGQVVNGVFATVGGALSLVAHLAGSVTASFGG